MSNIKKTISDPVGQLREALRLFQLGNKTKAIQLVFGPTHTNDYDQEGPLKDLYMETYIFFTEGDLRKNGRDFGYTSVDKIIADLDRYLESARKS
jgi:hypothetical protein